MTIEQRRIINKACKDRDITKDVTSSSYSKIEQRRIINKACKDRDIKDIMEGMEGLNFGTLRPNLI